MAKTKKPDNSVEQYRHKDKERVNNPPVGLVTSDTDKDGENKIYSYDPHLDPQLIWTGKAEHVSFEVPTVSLHVHERIDPRTIIQAVMRKEKTHQMSLFDFAEENPPLREAIEFYKHKHGWSNRLIAGDSLLVMNSLLEKEGMAGKVQMVYLDPPYGIKYGSNFQPFVSRRDVKDGNADDLTSEPEQIKAFRDTWELEIHSYLTYLRDRLLLSRDLLTDSGSIFVQISDDNLHHVKELMDEIFGPTNFIKIIAFQTTSGLVSRHLKGVYDFIIWYGKDISKIKYHQLFTDKAVGLNSYYDKVELPNGQVVASTEIETIPPGAKYLTYQPLLSGAYSDSTTFVYEYNGKNYYPGQNRCWKTTKKGLDNLTRAKRIYQSDNTLKFIRYFEDFPVTELSNFWNDTMDLIGKDYVVQTVPKVIERCVLMTTDPGDLVFDPTCGSGTTAFVAEKWGRRWITCDTSRVAITLSKQRLVTAAYDYFVLAHPLEGVSSGFKYETVPHVTLKSIANDEQTEYETLYNRPIIDDLKYRISGPFTVEAVPSPVVQPLVDEINTSPADESIKRSGETLRQSDWRDELVKTGIRGKGGQSIEFTRLETLPGMHWLHADGTTKESKPKRIVASFGPEHAPLEQRQVERAIEEARRLVPTPELIVFAAFQFDPEASKDIDETHWPGVTLLKAQMNADLLTEDLKKKKSSNESFWLVGQPDVKKAVLKNGDYQVEVLGFDYYNTKTGTIESGSSEKIAMWMLDTDYDGRSLYPRQVFFPMAGDKDGWYRLAKSLNSEIDDNLIEQYRGTISIPFSLGEHKRIAIKIIDDRGIESLRVLDV